MIPFQRSPHPLAAITARIVGIVALATIAGTGSVACFGNGSLHADVDARPTVISERHGTFVFTTFHDMQWSIRIVDRHGDEITQLPFGDHQIALVGVSDSGHILYSDTDASNLVEIDDSGTALTKWTADDLAHRLGFAWPDAGDTTLERVDRLTPMRACLRDDGRLDLLVKCRIPEPGAPGRTAGSVTYRYETILVYWNADGSERWRSPGGQIVGFASAADGGTILALDGGILKLDRDGRLVREIAHPEGVQSVAVSTDARGHLLASLAISEGAPGFDESVVAPGKPGKISRVGELAWDGSWVWSFPHPCAGSIQEIAEDRFLIGGG